MAFGSLTYEDPRARRWNSLFAGLGIDIYYAFSSTRRAGTASRTIVPRSFPWFSNWPRKF